MASEPPLIWIDAITTYHDLTAITTGRINRPQFSLGPLTGQGKSARSRGGRLRPVRPCCGLVLNIGMGQVILHCYGENPWKSNEYQPFCSFFFPITIFFSAMCVPWSGHSLCVFFMNRDGHSPVKRGEYTHDQESPMIVRWYYIILYHVLTMTSPTAQLGCDVNIGMVCSFEDV
jgi:hypothetical protein